MKSLPDPRFVRRQLNLAIHELVFAIQHHTDGQYDDALTCLATARDIMEFVSTRHLRPSLPPLPSVKNPSSKKRST